MRLVSLILAGSLLLAANAMADLRPVPGPRLDTIDQSPTVRVRVAAATPSIHLAGPPTLAVRSASDATIPPVQLRSPVTVARHGNAFLLRDAAGAAMTWRLRSMHVDSPSPTPLTLNGNALPGHLVLHPVDVPPVTPAAQPTPGIDAVNHVDLEAYLPGVLSRELYASWPDETFRAQAVAARSYALWERQRNQHRTHDLESTVASQAYAGVTDNPRAHRAVAATRGTVLGYDGRVVPAFYSSTVGRESQDAAAVFADRTPPIAPLRGGPRGDWDRASPHHQWPTLHRSIDDASSRVRAWAASAGHPASALTRITRIDAIPHPLPKAQTRLRPAGFLVHDARGSAYRFTAVDLRLALNYPAPRMPALPQRAVLKSSDCRFAVAGPNLVITDGYGYGHGVGMSQWGAHAMAKAGHDHRAILNHYYPGAALTRLYP
ncbi:MAG: SpoIID/LytB domain-containing protein [Planctomycetota bacterium]